MKFTYDDESDILYVTLNAHTGETKEYADEGFSVLIDQHGTIADYAISNASVFIASALAAGIKVEGYAAPVGAASTWEEVDSSMISAFKYEPSERVLSVMFVRTGLYHYFNVPFHLVDALRKSESKGSFMRSVIIDQYDCEKAGG